MANKVPPQRTNQSFRWIRKLDATEVSRGRDLGSSLDGLVSRWALQEPPQPWSTLAPRGISLTPCSPSYSAAKSGRMIAFASPWRGTSQLSSRRTATTRRTEPDGVRVDQGSRPTLLIALGESIAGPVTLVAELAILAGVFLGRQAIESKSPATAQLPSKPDDGSSPE